MKSLSVVSASLGTYEGKLPFLKKAHWTIRADLDIKVDMSFRFASPEEAKLFEPKWLPLKKALPTWLSWKGLDRILDSLSPAINGDRFALSGFVKHSYVQSLLSMVKSYWSNQPEIPVVEPVVEDKEEKAAEGVGKKTVGDDKN